MQLRENLSTPSASREVATVLRQADDSITYLQERLAELELALEDVGWQRIANAYSSEFSRAGLQTIMRLARMAFLKNPLINRAATIQALYVFARGVKIATEDEKANPVIQAFIEDPRNKAELFGHQARSSKEIALQVFGNLFFVLFSEEDSGDVIVRSLPAEEIDEIICDPNDACCTWYYKRVYVERTYDFEEGVSNEAQKTAYYPDWNYEPKAGERRKTIGGNPVMWDSPVYHRKVGGLPDMRFGVSELYQALDWAKAHKVFLENWSTITQSLARFAWQLKTKGGPGAVAAAKARLGTTYGSGESGEHNPAPVTGSTFIGSEGVEMAPIKTAGATSSPNDSRILLLMVAAAVGLPETFFGDASKGNHATAKTLDRPTELKFLDRQQVWTETYQDLCGYVLRRKEKSPRGGVRTQVTPVTIAVTWPPILDHDVAETVAAIVQGATLAGSSLAGTFSLATTQKALASALSIETTEEDEQFAAKKAEMALQAQQQLQTAFGQPKDGAPGQTNSIPPDEVAEAIRELTGELRALEAEPPAP